MKLIALLFSLALLFVTFSVPAAEPSPDIAELQGGLAELGYDPGPVDGLVGPKTREAIMAFQKGQKLTVDGEYSDILSMLVRRERERAPLLAMSDDELMKLIETSSEDALGRLFDLIPERVADFPISSTLGKALSPDVAEVLFFVPLRLLLYPPSRAGVEQFQADIGADVTGEPTLTQFFEAGRRWLRNRDMPVYTYGAAQVHMNDDLGWANVDGTWLTVDEEIITPINAVEITCDRDRRECLRVTAELIVPALDDDNSLIYLSPDDDYYRLQLRPTRRYDIISWLGGEIVAQENRGCDIALLTLNRNSNRVQEVVRNNEDAHPNCRNSTFDRPRIARLTSGSATTREFWRTRQGATGSYLNPRVWEDIKQAMGAAEPLGLPGPAIGPSHGTQPTLMERLERRRRELQAPVDKGNE